MAFRFNPLGQKVGTDPAAAHAELERLFKKHNWDMGRIAADLSVDSLTLRRWIKKLVALGYKDPGNGLRRMRGADQSKRPPRAKRPPPSKKRTSAVR